MPPSSCGRVRPGPTAGNTASSSSRQKWIFGVSNCETLSNMKPGSYPRPGQGNAMRPGANRQPTAEERRRAQRVLLRMPVIVHLTGKTNPIHGFTHTVSASGAMIILEVNDDRHAQQDRKSTRLNSSHLVISYAV